MSLIAVEPLIEELPRDLDPRTVFLRLSGLPHCLFLDSALRDSELGRYSFVAADPFDYLALRVDEDAFPLLERALGRYSTQAAAGFPPFQGGAAGLLGYDLGRQLEEIPPPRADEFHVPALALGLYDVVVAFDHVQQQGWIISQGLPESAPGPRRRRAAERLAAFRRRILEMGDPGEMPRRVQTPLEAPSVSVDRLVRQFPVGRLPDLTSNFSREGYLAAVERVIAYIEAGDVFQVNLAQRLLHPAVDESVSLYLRLRECNPAPFAGYFDLGPLQILSASPERFLQVRDGSVETRPIKGTRRRSGHLASDRQEVADLQASAKDRAENVMIVDLLRNDLSRVCRAESVRVSRLCGLEEYAFVHHLVSTVRGELQDGAGCIDLVRAAFPGGSVTGAPKVRAMEIIAELEPTARGAYCGSLGYLGLDGSMDLSILIRTITAGRGWWQAQVGGGIVAESVPEKEYEETWQKAEGLLRAFPWRAAT